MEPPPCAKLSKSLWWMAHSIFYWCAFLFIPTKKHHQNVDQIDTATFHGYSLVLTMPSYDHQACFMPVFSALFLYYYVTSILWHSNWKGVNRNNVKQDLYPTATTEKRQNWMQEVLAMVLLPQALVPNFFLCVLLHFFSLLFTNKHTHTSFPHFVLFESK